MSDAADGGLHEAVSVGFGREAATYAAARPDYPPEVVAILAEEAGVGPPGPVVDVAAGTGILTRRLLRAGYDVTAVEPVAAMRAELVAATPGVTARDGTAEALPLADRSVASMTVAQAFHWFDAPAALAEAARVLRPGGALLLVWNVRDESVEWVRRWTELVVSMSDGRPYGRRRPGEWAEVVAADGRFGPLHHRELANPVPTTPEGIVARARSTSFVAALDEARRDALLAAVADLVRTHPDLAGRASIVYPYLTDVFWCRRLD